MTDADLTEASAGDLIDLIGDPNDLAGDPTDKIGDVTLLGAWAGDCGSAKGDLTGENAATGLYALLCAFTALTLAATLEAFGVECAEVVPSLVRAADLFDLGEAFLLCGLPHVSTSLLSVSPQPSWPGPACPPVLSKGSDAGQRSFASKHSSAVSIGGVGRGGMAGDWAIEPFCGEAPLAQALYSAASAVASA